jgi:hypothetical protein
MSLDPSCHREDHHLPTYFDDHGACMRNSNPKILQIIAGVECDRAAIDRLIERLRAGSSDADATSSMVPLKAAPRAGYSIEAIRKLAAAGIVTAVKSGGRWLVSPESVLAHLARRRARGMR